VRDAPRYVSYQRSERSTRIVEWRKLLCWISESDLDERDSFLRQVKEELKNIGYRESNCGIDDEGK